MKFLIQSLLAFAASTAAFAPISKPSIQSTELYERKPFITGNWKLNPATLSEATDLSSKIAEAVTSDSPEVALFVPFPYIEHVQNIVGDKLEVGAQVKEKIIFD